MHARVRPSSAYVPETLPSQQRVRPTTANTYFNEKRSTSQSKIMKSQQFSKHRSLDRGPSVSRPVSAVERTEMYKRLLVDSVNKIHCPTLYRALCKVEKRFRNNRKARYHCAKMLYLAAVRGDFDYDDIQEHFREELDVFLSSPESRQLVIYGGLFSSHSSESTKHVIEEIKTASDVDSAADAAAAASISFQEDMRSCVKNMQLQVPPLYCYNKWCKDVKKLESRHHAHISHPGGVKKFVGRVAVTGTGCESSDCGGSMASFEDVMNAGIDSYSLHSPSLISHRSSLAMKSVGSDDDEDDFAPLPPPKKVTKFNKFKKIAFSIMAALPTDEGEIADSKSKNRKKGLQYLFNTGAHSPEYQRMVASLIRGDRPGQERSRGSVSLGGQGPESAHSHEDDEKVPIGGVDIVNSDEITQGYFMSPQPPAFKTGEESAASRRPFSPNPSSPSGSPSLSPCPSPDRPGSPKLMTLRSGSFDFHMDEEDSRPRSRSSSGLNVPLSDDMSVTIDSIPSSPVPKEKKKLGGAAMLRKVTIIESSVYAPPAVSRASQIKVASTVGLAKMKLLRKSSSFMAKQQQPEEQVQDTTAELRSIECNPSDRNRKTSSLTALAVDVSGPISLSASAMPSSKTEGEGKADGGGLRKASIMRGSPIRPTLSRAGSSGISLKKDDDDRASPTLSILNGLAAPFSG